MCERCGRFMCAPCCAHGAQARCTACSDAQQPGTFSLGPTAPFSEVLAYAWESFKRAPVIPVVATALSLGAVVMAHMVVQLGIVLVFGQMSEQASRSTVDLAILYAVSSVLTLVVGLFVQAFVWAGLLRLLMDYLVGGPGGLDRLVSQAGRFASFVGIQVVWSLPMSLSSIFSSLVQVASSAGDGVPASALLVLSLAGGVLSLLGLVGWFLVLPYAVFAMAEVQVGDCGALEAFRRVWRVTSGSRFVVLGISALGGLLVLLGLLLCGLPVLATFPVSLMLLLGTYLALRSGADAICEKPLVLNRDYSTRSTKHLR